MTRKKLRYSSVARPYWLSLMSDLHIGSPHANIEAIERDLESAREKDARILINGDLFDGILPKDIKRYKPTSVHPRLRNTDEPLDEAVEWAVEILGPYADLIDGIGMGNHEAAVQKYHSTNLIGRTIDALQKEHVSSAAKRAGHRISYLHYTGFVDYRYQKIPRGSKRPSSTRRLVIYYHHGSGGGAPVTKGMIDFQRRAAFVDSDIIWISHKHNRIADAGAVVLFCPIHGGEPQVRQRLCVMSGAYLESHHMGAAGDSRSYAADWGVAPQGLGGAEVSVKFHPRAGLERIQVTQ